MCLSEQLPNPYVIQRVNKWITCEDEDGPTGFAIKVRQYITNAERDDLVAVTNEIRRYSAEYLQMDPEQKATAEVEHGGTPRELEWRQLAPYIAEWNHAAENEDGAIVPVPSPADGGPDVFRLITPEQYSWCYDIVIRGYRAWGKAGSFSAE